jgi:hypothetical protein
MDKLSINNEMAQLDTKNRKFYDELTEEERKKFSTYLMLRYAASVEGSADLQEWYLRVTNERINANFFDLGKHPKLQWLCATAISPGMGTMRHNWIAPKKKEAGASAKRKQLQEIYPTYKDDEIEVMMQITTQKEIDTYFKSAGQDKKK